MQLDLGHLALFVGHAMNAKVTAQLRRGGQPKVRQSHGYLVQHLVERPRAIGELARRMGVTQQAVSKSVGELKRLGVVEVVRGSDARVREVALSARGRALLEHTRAVRTRLHRDLERRLGPRRAAQARALLAEALRLLGAEQTVLQRRVREPL
jgi:DNA-binding MarR family transcriptional regulator